MGIGGICDMGVDNMVSEQTMRELINQDKEMAKRILEEEDIYHIGEVFEVGPNKYKVVLARVAPNVVCAIANGGEYWRSQYKVKDSCSIKREELNELLGERWHRLRDYKMTIVKNGE